MAKLINGILGGFSGKIGRVVGVKKGKNASYIRAAPEKLSPEQKKARPVSLLQVAARARFSFLNTWLKKSTFFLSAGFAAKNPDLTGMQAASSANSGAVLGSYPDFSIDYSRIMVSGGEMPQPAHASVTADEPGIIEFLWNIDRQHKTLRPDDQSMVLLYFPETEESYYELFGSHRYTGKFALNLPPELSGKVGEAYLGFRSDDRSRASNSQYLGPIIVL